MFTRAAGGQVVPVVMLGPRSRENLFIDEREQWDARYVPAFVRRYPFVLAELPGRSLAVCIDEAYAGLNESEGEPLFDAQGGDTPFLRNALEFLSQYQREYLRTGAFCRRLDQAGLLTAMDARADLVDRLALRKSPPLLRRRCRHLARGLQHPGGHGFAVREAGGVDHFQRAFAHQLHQQRVQLLRRHPGALHEPPAVDRLAAHDREHAVDLRGAAGLGQLRPGLQAEDEVSAAQGRRGAGGPGGQEMGGTGFLAPGPQQPAKRQCKHAYSVPCG